ncbi:MAG: adenylate/guanylate cyclase domain-containing protein [Actinomycetota bacterium]|nr:adenylate/guanylate cyclase domain-containing protein [Actinomycetota bacterium]
MPGWADRALLIAVIPDDDQETTRTKRLMAGVLWVSLPITVLSAMQLGVVFEAPAAGLTVGSAFVAAAVSLFVMWRWPATYPGIAHLPIANAILISAALVVMAGGLLASGVNAVWGFVAVLAALAVLGDRAASFWLWFFIVSQVVAVVWGSQIEPIYAVTNVEYVAVFNLLIVVVFVYYMMLFYVRQRAFLLSQSDGLLRNILPNEIADRLKTSTEKIADAYDSASILFADIVDFTPMSADMAPSELVALLDEVFTAFDVLVEERGLEKIKTIGDAYMVAAGVPVPREDHAQILCDLALAVQALVDSREFQGRRVSFRIGVNSGEVVAGIIGTKKFSYDLWGDSVNTASRMESTSTAGEIQIAETTKRLVEQDFICEPKGTVEVKGKGPITVWAVIGHGHRL